MTGAARLRTAGRLLFAPNQVTNLAAWWDATQLTGFADNDPVGSFPDASGSGLTLTAAGGLRPLYKTAILNSHPVLRFDGFNTLSRASVTGTGLFGASAVTIVAVQKQDGGQANNTTLFWSAAGNRVNAHLTYSDTLYFDYGDAGGGGRINGAQPSGWDDAWKVVSLHRNGAAGNVIVNGVNALSGSFTDDLDPTQTNTLNVGGDGGVVFKGDIAELLIYSRALTTIERQGVERGLGAKYGVVVA